jgi:hypothetical protein
MVEILPTTDWSQDSNRPVLHLLLRRLERLFSKIYKKPVLRVCSSLLFLSDHILCLFQRHLDWDSAANMLKGNSYQTSINANEILL